METTSYKLKYNVCESKNSNAIPVIIVAAGKSSRMRGVNKQFISVAGIPVIARSLMNFEHSPYISRIILVTREENIPDMQLIAEKYLITKISDIVKGGDTRQESVFCGIERLGKDEDKVLVSDGARIFVTDKMIKDCVDSLKHHDGCLCAVKVNDTVKLVENGTVKDTVKRDKLYLAQTPQGITISLYKKAKQNTDVSVFTDDASVLESMGADVVVVDGDIKNIKITTPEDIVLAENLVKGVGLCE